MTSNNGELVITRMFNAPRDLVWKSFTELERLKVWWGPKGFPMLAATLDLTPGGMFHYCMRMPNGADMWAKFTYREIRPQTFLSFLNGFSDKTGGDGPNPWLPVWPKEVLYNFTFEEQDGKTLVTLRGYPLTCSEEEHQAFTGLLSSMQGGFAGTWEKLDGYLAAQQK